MTRVASSACFARISATRWKRFIITAAMATSMKPRLRPVLGRNTRFVGWGAGFFDYDNDGWPDLLLVNGHVFPEVDKLHIDIHFRDGPSFITICVTGNLKMSRFQADLRSWSDTPREAQHLPTSTTRVRSKVLAK